MRCTVFMWNCVALMTAGSMVGGGEAFADKATPTLTNARVYELQVEHIELIKKYRNDDGSGFEAYRDAVAAFVAKAKAEGAAERIADYINNLNELLERLTRRRATLDLKKQDERIVAGAVMARFPGKYTLEDSIKLDKVSAAFAESDLKDFVVRAKTSSKRGLKGRRAREIPPAHAEADVPRRTRRSTRNAAPRAQLMWAQGELTPAFAGTSRSNLAPGIVGLMWTVRANTDVVLVVTLDGGRYWTSASELVLGIPDADTWSSPSPMASFYPAEIAALAEAGQLAKKRRAAWESANKGARACSKKIWDAADRKFARIHTANILERTRENRKAALREQTAKAERVRCNVWLKRAEAAWQAALTDRTEARRAAYERNKAKLVPRLATRKVASGN
ncbi:MAG: hypothetical protein HYY84_02580 [Deltaproteobacteria bacterium]|nr:hypothetical protein [Deltaproteobacteria bacterium]